MAYNPKTREIEPDEPVVSPLTRQDDDGNAGQVYAIDPTGEVVKGPASLLQATGYYPASPKQIEEHQLHEKYGGAGQTAAGIAEQLASGATLGLSEGIERAVGVPGEDIEGRAQVRPAVSGAVNLLGAAAPVVLSGGAAAPEEALARGAVEGAGAVPVAAEAVDAATAARAAVPAVTTAADMLPSAVVNRVGNAIEEAVGKGTIKANAARWAAEGALYGVQPIVHEAAIGDPEDAVDGAWDHVATGAIFGGGLGAGLGALGKVVPFAARKAAHAVDNALNNSAPSLLEKIHPSLARMKAEDPALYEAMISKLRTEGGSVRDAVADYEAAHQLARPIRPERPPGIEREELPDAIPRPETPPGITQEPSPAKPVRPEKPPAIESVDIDKHATELAAALKKDEAVTGAALKGFNEAARPEEARIFTASIPEHVALTEALRADEALSNTIEQLPHTGGFRRGLEAIKSNLADGALAERAGSFETHDALKRVVKDLGYWSKFGKEIAQTPENAEAIAAVKSLRATLRDGLANEAVWGRLGAREAAIRPAYTEFLNIQRKYHTAFFRKVETTTGAPEFIPNEEKIIKFLKDAGRAGNAYRERVFAGYQRAARAFNEVMADSATNAHVPHDAPGVEHVLTESARVEAANRAALNAADAASTQRAAQIAKDRLAHQQATAERAAAVDKIKAEYRAATAERKEFVAKQNEEFARAKEIRKTAIDEQGQKFSRAKSDRAEEIRRQSVEFQRAKDAYTATKAARKDRIDSYLRAMGGPLHGSGFSPYVVGAAVGHGGLAYGAFKAAQFASSPGQSLRTLSALQRLNDTLQTKIQQGVNAIIKGGARASAVGRTEVEAGIHKVFGKSADDNRREYEKNTERLRTLSSDPKAMLKVMTDATEGWSDHAPETAQAMQLRLQKTVQFLNSKLPVKSPSLFGDNSPPSQADMAKFNRSYEAALVPLSTVKQAAAGTLTPESLEAFSVLHPSLKAKVNAQLLTSLTDMTDAAKAKVPFAARQSISMLLATPVDPLMKPPSIQANQATLAGPTKQASNEPPPPRPTVKGVSHIDIAGATALGAQNPGRKEA